MTDKKPTRRVVAKPRLLKSMKSEMELNNLSGSDSIDSLILVIERGIIEDAMK